MNVDLENKSKELKELVSQYETHLFLGELSMMIHFITNDTSNLLSGLSSPLRQLYYLASLNITSHIPADKPLKGQFSDDEWQKMKQLLTEIELGYQQIFYPKLEIAVDEEWQARRMVAVPQFLSYFNQGPLNYEEQIIERVIEYFTPFDAHINSHFGIGVNDFIDIYNFIDSLPNKFLEEKITPKGGHPPLNDFINSMVSSGLPPDEWQSELPQQLKNLFNFVADKGSAHRFTRDQLISKFSESKSNSFLSALTCERKESNFLYYTEKSILYSRPIFQVGTDEYQYIEANQVIHAIFNTLAQFCIETAALKEKFYKKRGKQLEEKTERVFQKFFDNKAVVYKSYFTEEKHEQDLLFLINGVALIVEAKASKRDEPKRDPDKAYPEIVFNFGETIQKGYDQAYRVKSKFIEKTTLRLYKDQFLKNHIIDLRTKKYYSVFSIIVTLDSFGSVQTDLSELLELYDDDEYPWSVRIDDLETFLLFLKKKKKKVSDLVQFLKFREQLHGRLICSDELEVCGAFIQKSISKEQMKPEQLLILKPDLADIFDQDYHNGGLGFEEEKNLHYKLNSDKYIKLGG